MTLAVNFHAILADDGHIVQLLQERKVVQNALDQPESAVNKYC